MQLQRPPNLCVAFEGTPEGITAAHNSSMKAVAVASPQHPAYKLRSADVTVACLSDLTVYNVRRLFANEDDELMKLKKQRSSDKDKGGSGRKRITNAVI